MDKIDILINKAFENLLVRDLIESFHLAKKKISALEVDHAIYINNRPASLFESLMLGDVVQINASLYEKLDFIPEDQPTLVLYEDDWVYALEKEPGMIIYPETKDGLHTMANRAAGYLQSLGLDRNVRYLHRLDRDTSGAMLFAKHFLAHAFLDYYWNHVDITREYLAIVEGILPKKIDRIDLPIGKNRHQNNHYIVYRQGKPATTVYEVLETKGNHSLVKLALETGRTHQIRVHMAYIGHPIVGDEAYGATRKANRILLHSHRIEFVHPYSRKKTEVVSMLPEDMVQYWKALQ